VTTTDLLQLFVALGTLLAVAVTQRGDDSPRRRWALRFVAIASFVFISSNVYFTRLSVQDKEHDDLVRVEDELRRHRAILSEIEVSMLQYHPNFRVSYSLHINFDQPAYGALPNRRPRGHTGQFSPDELRNTRFERFVRAPSVEFTLRDAHETVLLTFQSVNGTPPQLFRYGDAMTYSVDGASVIVNAHDSALKSFRRLQNASLFVRPLEPSALAEVESATIQLSTGEYLRFDRFKRARYLRGSWSDLNRTYGSTSGEWR